MPTQPRMQPQIATSKPALPWLSLAEAQRQSPFHIRVPHWIPSDLTLRGIIVGAGPSGDGSKPVTKVVVSYASIAKPSGGLVIEQTNGENPLRKNDDSTLSWDADGLTYVLRAPGLGLAQSDLRRIQTSVR